MSSHERPATRVVTRVSRGVQYLPGSVPEDVFHEGTGRPMDTFGRPARRRFAEQFRPTFARPHATRGGVL